MTCAPKNLELKAANYGFTVHRTYAGVDNSADVQRDTSGIWHFRYGQRVRVTLTMTNVSRRYHVALCDYLPAGLEALNTTLVGTVGTAGEKDDEKHACPFFSRIQWFDHQNLRDERCEAFCSILFEGEHKWSYEARATTRGNFCGKNLFATFPPPFHHLSAKHVSDSLFCLMLFSLVPPARAEEMYSPENFGRSSSERVRVA